MSEKEKTRQTLIVITAESVEIVHLLCTEDRAGSLGESLSGGSEVNPDWHVRDGWLRVDVRGGAE